MTTTMMKNSAMMSNLHILSVSLPPPQPRPQGMPFSPDESPGFADGWSNPITPGLSKASVVRTETLTPLDVVARRTKQIEETMSVLEVSRSVTSALLRHMHWNQEGVLARYFENPQKMLKSTGLLDGKPSKPGPQLQPSDEVECGICCDDVPARETFAAICDHRFCSACWQNHVDSRLSEGMAVDIPCMQFKCPAILNEEQVENIVGTHGSLHDRYLKFIAKSYVDERRNLRWCPNPKGCDFVAYSETRSNMEVACKCGYKFCFICHDESHKPCDCEMMVKWKKKCEDDSETANWLVVNTKPCPKCTKPIEKSGGCNHMTCRKAAGGCGHEFCWTCGRDYRGHGTCNSFQPGTGAPFEKRSSKAGSTRVALERYLHYFTRYSNHNESKKFEQALRQAAIQKMLEFREKHTSEQWIDVTFLDTATEVLINCRRVLKYTYVFAFYLANEAEKELFEFLQSELESTTEALSRQLENAVDEMDRREIVNLEGLARRRLQHLLDGVEEGLTTNADARKFTTGGIQQYQAEKVKGEKKIKELKRGGH